MKTPRLLSGFTLIELMLVVAIIGLLAAIAIPKFANLVVKAKEASVKGKLGTLRSAVSIYYADNEGVYPISNAWIWTAMTVGGRYLDTPLSISIPTYPAHPEAFGAWGSVSDWVLQTIYRSWAYNSVNGSIHVNCIHTDSQGTTWSQW